MREREKEVFQDEGDVTVLLQLTLGGGGPLPYPCEEELLFVGERSMKFVTHGVFQRADPVESGGAFGRQGFR